MTDETRLEERKFEFEAEIRRREIKLKEAEAGRGGLTASQAAVAGAVLALVSGVRPDQFGRIGIVTEPSIVIVGREHDRHPVMQTCDELVGPRRHDRERPNPFVARRFLPVLPEAGEGKSL
jgi:hypothetical protein